MGPKKTLLTFKIDYPTDNFNYLKKKTNTAYEIDGISNKEIPANVCSTAAADLVSIVIGSADTVSGLDVTSIGVSAFYNCTSLRSLTYDESNANGFINNVGNNAFNGCTSLTTITLSNVTNIGDSAFNNCNKLTSITIPTTVKRIGTSAFNDCTNLTSIIFTTPTPTITNIGDSAFNNCNKLLSIIIPNTVTSIGASAFNNCTSLTSVTMDLVTLNRITLFVSIFQSCTTLSISDSTSIRNLPSTALQNNNKLTSITIPNTVTSIGASIFTGCNALTSVIFTTPSVVKSIGNDAFTGCTALISITIPNTVTSIVESAFTGCTALTSVTMDLVTLNRITSFVSSFQSCTTLLINDNTSTPIRNLNSTALQSDTVLTSITIPNTVTSIGASVFSGCNALTSVIFATPSVVKSIGNDAFSGCTALISISIPSSVTSVGQNSNTSITSVTMDLATLNKLSVSSFKSIFISCTTLSISDSTSTPIRNLTSTALQSDTVLTSISIPNTITNIGASAFSGCTALTSVTMDLATLNRITSFISIFPSCTTLSISDSTPIRNLTSTGLQNNSVLRSITIPNTVTSIGASAFSGCTALTSVTMDLATLNRITSFTSIFPSCTTLSISDITPTRILNVTSLQNNNKLTSITIPNTITSIGASVFNSCTNLTSVTMDLATLNVLSESSFITSFPLFTTLIINDSVPTSILNATSLRRNNKLVSVTIPESVTSIGSYVFVQCYALTTVIFLSMYNINKIERNTFNLCVKLENITIPESVTSIGTSAFGGTNINTISGINVVNIDEYAFTSCDKLTSVHFPKVTTIAAYAFINAAFRTVEFPELTTIPANVFQDCKQLQSVDFQMVTVIRAYAFKGCSSLTSITIPKIRRIEGYSFIDCTGLETIRLETITEYIEPNVFTGCSLLKTIYTSVDFFLNITPQNDLFSQTRNDILIDNDKNPILRYIINTDATLTHVTIDYYNLFYIYNSICKSFSDIFTACRTVTITDSHSITEPNYGFFQLFVDKITGDGILNGISNYWINNNWHTTYFNNITNIILDPTVVFFCNPLTNVTDVTIDTQLISILNNFDSFPNVNTLIITDSYITPLSSIRKSYFNSITKITNVTIPVSIINSDSIFNYCNTLTMWIDSFDGLSDNNRNWYTSIFPACNNLILYSIDGSKPIKKDIFSNSTNNVTLRNVIINNHINNVPVIINEDAFKNCTALTSFYVYLGHSASSIDNNAFNGCSNLYNFDLTTSTDIRIDWNAFNGCAKLTSLIIPLTVVTINTNPNSRDSGKFTNFTTVTIDANTLNVFYTNQDNINEFSYFSSIFGTVSTVTITNINTINYIKDYSFHGVTSLTNVSIEETITSIGSYAFKTCGFYSITIPSNIVSIGNGILSNCRSLTAVNLSQNISIINYETFERCISLIYITIPDNVTRISVSAFNRCTSITSITFSSNSILNYIHDYAFYLCTNLSSMQIPTGVTFIGDHSFEGCDNLTSVQLPINITELFSYTFQNCYKLSYISIPNRVTSIGVNTFGGCISLTTAKLPYSLISISSNSFENCNVLTSVILDCSNNVSNILSFFTSCNSLKIIAEDNKVRTISQNAFSTTTSNTKIQNINISNGVTSIGVSAFSKYTALTNLNISETSINSIGNFAFSGCTALPSISITSTTNINMGTNIFEGCTALTNVSLSNNVTNIGNFDFSGCINLPSILIPQNIVTNTVLGTSIFSNCTLLTQITMTETLLQNITSNKLQIPLQTNLLLVSSSTSTSATIDVSILPNVDINVSRISGVSASFPNCNTLTIENATSLVSIPANALYNIGYTTSNNTLKTIIIVTTPTNIVSIGDNAFRNCSGLISINIPFTITSISDTAFSGCANLTSLTLDCSNSVVDILSKFSNCNTLTIIAGGTTKTILQNAFSATTPNTKIQNIIIPTQTASTSAKSIGINAFVNYTALTSITITQSSITSIGDSAFSGCILLPSISIPASVTSIGQNVFLNCIALTSVSLTSVNSIGDSAFSGCILLPSISTPASVTSIGKNVFVNCIALTSVSLTSVNSIGEYDFSGCTSLPSITLPRSATTIGQYAFSGCTSLTKVALPGSITTTGVLGTNIFSGCTALTQIDMSAGLIRVINSTHLPTTYTYQETSTPILFTALVASSATSVTIDASILPNVDINISRISGVSASFTNCSTLTIGNATSLVSIPANALYNTGYTIPNSILRTISIVTTSTDIVSVGNNAFRNCSGLTSINIPTTVTGFGEAIFSGCSAFKTISLPTNLQNINNYDFSGCTGLTTISIPISVSVLGEYIFSGCSNITSVTLPPNNDNFKSINNYDFAGCIKLTSINIPYSITSISNTAFIGCTSLTSIAIDCFSLQSGNSNINIFTTFPDCNTISILDANTNNNAKIIPNNAFINNTVLRNISTIADTITSIGQSAFYSCTALTNISLGTGINNIGISAFAYCTSLPTITMPSAVTYIGDNAFSLCTSLRTINIPNGITAPGSIGTNAFYEDNISTVTADLVTINGINMQPSIIPSTTLYVTVTSSGSGTTINSNAFYGYTNIPLTIDISSTTINAIAANAINNCSGTTLELKMYSILLSTIDSSIFNTSTYNTKTITLKTAQFTSTTIDCSIFPYINSNIFSSSTTLTITNTQQDPYIGIPNSYFKSKTTIRSITIGEYINSIGQSAFETCRNLTSITFTPTSVITNIGSYAFAGCSLSSTLTIPTSLMNIGTYAFTDSSLNNITIPSALTRIDDYAFYRCSKLSSVTFTSTSDNPPTINYIGVNAFALCTVLSSITIPDSITNINSYSFSNCTRLSSVTFNTNSNLVNIGDYAFQNDTSLNTIRIPNTVTQIGSYAFNSCTALTSVTFVNTPTISYIDSNAFSTCSKLSTITIPISVTSIGVNAFSACSLLTSVTMSTNLIQTIRTPVFGSLLTSTLKLYNTDTDSTTNPVTIDNYILQYLINYTSTGYAFNSIFSNCSSLTITNRNNISTIATTILSIGSTFFRSITNSIYIDASINDISANFSMAPTVTIGSALFNKMTTKTFTNYFTRCSNLTIQPSPTSVTLLKIPSISLTGVTNVNIAYGITSIDTSFNKANTVTLDGSLLNNMTTKFKSHFPDCSNLTINAFNPVSINLFNPTPFNNVTNVGFSYGINQINSTFSNASSVTMDVNTINQLPNFGKFPSCNALSINSYISSPITLNANVFNSIIYYPTNININGTFSITNITSAFRACTNLTIWLETIYSLRSRQSTWFNSSFPSCNTVILSYGGFGSNVLGSDFSASNIKNINIASTPPIDISTNAFANCSQLTSISINHLQSIDSNAFLNCSNLTTIAIMSTLNNVLTIDWNAFTGSTKLTSLSIPQSVTSIITQSGSITNGSLTNFTNVKVDINTLRYISQYRYLNDSYPNFTAAFSGSSYVTITNDLTPSTNTIPELSFYPRENVISNLTSVIIPNNITSIGISAFNSCTNLSTIDIPTSVVNISINAFRNCTSLSSIIIPYSVTTMDDVNNSVFSGCTNLTAVTIDCNTLNNIPYDNTNNSYTNGPPSFYNKFPNCTNLTITAESLSRSIPSNNIDLSYSYTDLINNTLKNVVINTGVTSIQENAFKNCTNLSSIIISYSVTSMDDVNNSVFSGCTNLTAVTIDCNTLNRIQYNPSMTTNPPSFYNKFPNCSTLTITGSASSGNIPANSIDLDYYNNVTNNTLRSVIITTDVVTITPNAFKNCTSLTSVSMPWEFLKYDNQNSENISNIFTGCTLLKITNVNSIPSSTNSLTIDSSIFPFITFSSLFSQIRELTINNDKPGNNALPVSALENCSNLTSITMPYNLVNYINITNTGYISGTNNARIYISNTPSNITIDYSLFANYISSTTFNNVTTVTFTNTSNVIINVATNVFTKLPNIQTVYLPNNDVTSIGTSAFSGCTRLQNIFIPNSVTSIGTSAFYGCTSLQNVNIPNSISSINDSVFSGCIALQSITIPNSITSIGINAFSGSGLLSITIPNRVTSIGTTAFSGCSSLQTVNIPNSVTSIATSAFSGCINLQTINIPTSIKSISAFVFSGCTSLHTIYLPDGITSIGNSAFFNCPNISFIAIPSSVTNLDISNSSFLGCTNLKNVIISCNTLNNISYTTTTTYPNGPPSFYNKFPYCQELTILRSPNARNHIPNMSIDLSYSYTTTINTALTSVFIEQGVTDISAHAFQNCSNLASVRMPNDLSATLINRYTNIEGVYNNIFDGCPYLNTGTNIISIGTPTNVTIDCAILPYITFSSTYSSCTSVSITNNYGYNNISISAFSNCTNINTVNMPNTLKSIDRLAFNNCSGITSLSLPSDLTTLAIDNTSFYGCSGLTDVFVHCNLLNGLYDLYDTTIIYQNGPPSFYNNFSRCKKLIISGDFTRISAPFIHIPYYSIDLSNNLTISNISNIDTNTSSGTINTTLTEVIVIPGVLDISAHAFQNCTSLTKVSISTSLYTTLMNRYSTVTGIRDNIFDGCDSLPTSNISEVNYADISIDCKDITDNPENNIGFLQRNYPYGSILTITNNSSEHTIRSGAFDYTGISDIYPRQLISIIITSGITSIGENTFINNTNLMNVTIPSTVSTLLANVFDSCTSLTNVIFQSSPTMTPNGITTIDMNAFNGCSALKSLTIPGSVTSIIRSESPNSYTLTSVTIDVKAIANINTPIVGVTISSNFTTKITNYNTITLIDEYNYHSIPSYAFYNTDSYTSLKTITIPNTITTINEYAFYKCIGLTEVIFQDNSIIKDISPNAFSGCTNLSSIVIPASITKINNNAFENCTNMTSITFETNSQLNYIGSNIFDGCTRLSSLIIPPLVTYVGANTNASITNITIDINTINNVPLNNQIFNFINTITVTDSLPSSAHSLNGSIVFGNPLSVTLPLELSKISNNVFLDCTGLTTIIFTSTSNITNIGAFAFKGCTSLPSITLPVSVSIINDSTFKNCSSLTGISITHITNIGPSAFLGCSSLSSISIPDNVTSIGLSAFSGCSRLSSISIPPNMNIINDSTFQNCSNLTTITISSANITSIGSSAFSGCTSLPSITLPTTLRIINNNAFFGCSQLNTVTMNNTDITSIGSSAFSGCTSLTNISIPSTVTSLDDEYNSVFAGCTNLTIVTIDCNTLNSISYSTTTYSYGPPSFYNKFPNCSDLTITGLSTYKNIPSNSIDLSYNNVLINTALQNIIIDIGVTSIDETAFKNCTSLQTISIPDSVSIVGSSVFFGCFRLLYITIPLNIITINESTFQNCSNLTTITISSANITSIGSSAFSGCTSLPSINLPPSVNIINSNAFSGCTQLSTVTMQNGITNIGPSAFSGCTSLTNINIPSTVTSLDDANNSVFAGCTNLTSVTIDCNTLNSIRYYTGSNYYFGPPSFYNKFPKCSDLTITSSNLSRSIPRNNINLKYFLIHPNGIQEHLENDTLQTVVIGTGVTSIDETAFQNCTNLQTISIPDSVSIVGASAFERCHILSSVSISSTNSQITSIGSYAFYHCISLLSITIPNNITSINESTFNNCYNLATVTIEPSANITSIGSYSFYGCTSLLQITLPNRVSIIGSYAFYGCTSLLQITLPNRVSIIGSYAFYECNLLPSIHIEGVSIINDYTFYECSGLTNITISNTNITSIGSYAFYGCSNLPSITIPININIINDSTFQNCSSLTSVTITTANITSIGSNAFSNCISLTNIIIPYSVTSLDDTNNSVFAGCTHLTSVTIDCNTLNSIRPINRQYNPPSFYNKFPNCSDLTITGLSISNTKNIPANSIALSYNNILINTSLQKVVIGTGVTSISDSAFSGCSNLNFMSMSSAMVQTIYSSMFTNCSRLTSITISDTNTSPNIRLDCSTFKYIQYIPFISIFTNCTSLQITDNSTDNFAHSISNTNNMEDTSISSITIPYSITAIDNSVFNTVSSYVVIMDANSLNYIRFTSGSSKFQNIFRQCNALVITNTNNTTTITNTYISDITMVTISSGITSIIDSQFTASIAYIDTSNTLATIASGFNSILPNCKSLIITDVNKTETIRNANINSLSTYTLTIPYGIKSITDSRFNNAITAYIDTSNTLAIISNYFDRNRLNSILPNISSTILTHVYNYYNIESLTYYGKSITIPYDIISIAATFYAETVHIDVNTINENRFVNRFKDCINLIITNTINQKIITNNNNNISSNMVTIPYGIETINPTFTAYNVTIDSYTINSINKYSDTSFNRIFPNCNNLTITDIEYGTQENNTITHSDISSNSVTISDKISGFENTRFNSKNVYMYTNTINSIISNTFSTIFPNCNTLSIDTFKDNNLIYNFFTENITTINMVSNTPYNFDSVVFNKCTNLTIWIDNLYIYTFTSPTSFASGFPNCKNIVLQYDGNGNNIINQIFDNSKLQNVNINAVQSIIINSDAFSNCTDLTSLVVNNLLSIGPRAFYACNKFTSLVINNCQDNTFKVESDAFLNCALKSISIPSSIIAIYNANSNGIPVLSNFINVSIELYTLNSLIQQSFNTIFPNCNTINISNVQNQTTLDIGVFVGPSYSASYFTSIIIPNAVTRIINKTYQYEYTQPSLSKIKTITFDTKTLQYLPSTYSSYFNHLFPKCDSIIITNNSNNPLILFWFKLGFNLGSILSLTAITLSSTINRIPVGEFNSIYGYVNQIPYIRKVTIDTSTLTDISNVEIIPNNVNIPNAFNYFFPNCSSLIITDDNILRNLYELWFPGSVNIKSIVIPTSITNIVSTNTVFKTIPIITIDTNTLNSITSSFSTIFSGCTSLTITDNSFNIVSNNTLNIGWISGCTLNSIEISSYVTSIINITNLESVKNVTIDTNTLYSVNNDTILLQLFPNCNSVIINDNVYTTNININNRNNTLRTNWFYPPLSLTSIIISDNIINITGDPLSLKNVTINTNTLNNIYSRFSTYFSTYFPDCENVIITSGSNKYIKVNTFAGCSKLTSIVIPSSVINISGIITTNQSLTLTIDVNTLRSTSVTIASSFPNLVKAIITDDFNFTFNLDKLDNCRELKTIVIPSTITTITGNSTILANVTIDVNTLNSIAEPISFSSLFENCTSITITNDFNINPLILTSFSGTNLTSMSFPSSITNITSNSSLYNITTVTIELLAVYNIHQPDNSKLFSTIFPNCTYINLTNNNNSTTITAYDFLNCTQLTYINMPNNISRIEDNAFYTCTNYTNVVIPISITEIGKNAFYNCTTLTTDINYLSFIKTDPDPNTINNFDTDGILTVAFPNIQTIVFNGNNQNGNTYIPRNIIASNTYPNTSLLHISIPNDSICTSINNNAFEYCQVLTRVDIQTTSITYIGNSAFNECKLLTALTIPYSVTSIGTNISSYITTITIDINTSNIITNPISSSFPNCNSIIITDTFSASTHRITSGAFQDLSITRLTIPNSITSITTDAFKGCLSLTSIIMSETLIQRIASDIIPDVPSTLVMQLIPPSSLTAVTIDCSIMQYINFFNTFPQCRTLTIRNDANKNNIPNNALYDGVNDNTIISQVLIASNITSIGDDAFKNCSGLSTINITSTHSIQTIGENAFAGCTSLPTITIPNSIANIGNYAFAGCSELTSINMPTEVTSTLCTIGDYAFAGCTKIKTITIPSNVTSIGVRVFANCTSLTNINIIGNIKSIGEGAFYGCGALRKITIPSSVITIGNNVFSGCSNVTIYTTNVNIYDDSLRILYNCNNCNMVYVSNVPPVNLKNKWYGNSKDRSASAVTHNANAQMQNYTNNIVLFKVKGMGNTFCKR